MDMCELGNVTNTTFNREVMELARMAGNFCKALLERNILEWMPHGVSDLCHYDSGLLINYILEQVAQQRVSVHNRHIYLILIVVMPTLVLLFWQIVSDFSSNATIFFLTTLKLCLYEWNSV